MPTGLTSKIYDGTDMSLRSFALYCAAHTGYGYRATEGGNSALPTDKAPVVKPNDWYKELVEKYEKELATCLEWKENPVKANKEYYEEYKRRTQINEHTDEESKKRKELKKRYESMIATVDLWDPGEDYAELKAFMIEQLRKSIEYDCSEYTPTYSEMPPIDEWIDKNIENCYDSVAYYKKKYADDCEEVKKANLYLKGLYDSLDDFEKRTCLSPFEKEIVDLLTSDKSLDAQASAINIVKGGLADKLRNLVHKEDME